MWCHTHGRASSKMIQSLFIMSKTGEVMIEKHWRGITPRNVCDFFWDEVNRHDVPDAVPPILQVSRCWFYPCTQHLATPQLGWKRQPGARCFFSEWLARRSLPGSFSLSS